MQENPTFQLKSNKLLDTSHTSDSLKAKQLLVNSTNLENEQVSKSTTKLPPIKKGRVEQMIQDKIIGIHIPSQMQRNITQPNPKYIIQSQNTNVVRKFNSKKKIQKKKLLNQSFKPQIISRFQQYLSFISCINLSNNIRITCEQLQTPYILFVAKGNNGPLIKNIFKTYRPWWTIQQEDYSNKNINLYWYQLRQNNILQNFKQNNFAQTQFDKLDYYAQLPDAQDKPLEQKNQNQSKKDLKRTTQRSQSLNVKDISSLQSKKCDQQPYNKRSTSKSKITNKTPQKINRLSPIPKNQNIKQLKQVGFQSQMNITQKKFLTNPKMWPVYLMFRKIFSATDMKTIKKLGIIKQDGRIQGKLLRNKMRTISSKSNLIKMHNHLQNNWNLSNKKALFSNVRTYFQAQKINPFDYIPMTFHVQKMGDKQYDNFVQQYHKRCDQITHDQKTSKKLTYKNQQKSQKKRNAWLVKPGQNTNRGNGIQVVQNLDQIKQIILKDNTDDQGRPRTHIIQQYIMPFLYQKRKFDIRCYILITSINGIQKGYWFQDGYIRTACKEFNMKNLSNKMIHLTNDAVQKKCQEYGKYQPGNKLSFSDFQRYLDTCYNGNDAVPKLKFWQQAYPQMKKLATQVIRSVYTKINPTKKQFTFQIFGLDFLIDQSFKVWLIEANTNPCLQLSSPLLGRVIPTMLENAFKIAVDTVFPPPPLTQIGKLMKKIVLPENSIENNRFQLVFDECQQGAQLKSLITNTPQVPIYNIQQQQQQYQDQDKDKQNCKQNCIN